MATFKNAFAEARKAGKKTFSWNGKSYTTDLRADAAPKTSVRPTAKPTASKAKPTPKPAASKAPVKVATQTGKPTKAKQEANQRKAAQEDRARRMKASAASKPAAKPAKEKPAKSWGEFFKGKLK